MSPSAAEPDPLEPKGERRRSIRAWLRFALLVGLILTGVALARWGPVAEYLDVDRAVGALQAVGRHPWAPAALIGLWAVCTPLGLPVSPLVFAGAAVFGTMNGWLYSLIGATLASGTSFWAARLLGHDLLARLLGAERLDKLEELVGRHGFWTVFRLRFVFLPFFLINFAAALAGMRFGRFMLATVLGLIPTLLVYNYFAHALVDATAADRQGVWRNLAIAMLAFLAITVLPQIIAKVKSRG